MVQLELPWSERAWLARHVLTFFLFLFLEGRRGFGSGVLSVFPSLVRMFLRGGTRLISVYNVLVTTEPRILSKWEKFSMRNLIHLIIRRQQKTSSNMMMRCTALLLVVCGVFYEGKVAIQKQLLRNSSIGLVTGGVIIAVFLPATSDMPFALSSLFFFFLSFLFLSFSCSVACVRLSNDQDVVQLVSIGDLPRWWDWRRWKGKKKRRR